MPKRKRRSKPKRRANGEGSFYFRESDRRWCAVWDGRTKTDKTEAGARQKWKEMKEQSLLGYDHKAAKNNPLTIEEAVRRLIHSGLSESTREYYGNSLRYLLPYLGSRPISTITLRNVEEWIELLDQAYGPSEKVVARRTAYSLLKRACRAAAKKGILGKSPFDMIDRKDVEAKPPKYQRKPINPPSSNESARIMRETRDDRYHVAYALGLLAGMRPCEIFGLRWSRIDWTRCVLIVDQAAVVTKGKVRLKNYSKTAAAYREIPLIPHVIEALKLRRKWADAEGQSGHELVIPARTGNPMNREVFASFQWKRMLLRVGLNPRRPYDARHSCATLMISSGVPLQVIAKIVGHADVKTTIINYGHVMPGDTGKAMQSLSQVIDTSTKQLLHALHRKSRRTSK